MPSILTNPSEFAARLMDGAEEASIRIAQDDFVKQAAENSKASQIIMPEAKLRLFSRHSEALTENFSNLTIKETDTDGSSELDHAKSFSLTDEELNRLKDDLEETDDNIDPLEVTKSASSFPFTWPRYLIEGADNRADFLKIEMETRVSFMEAMDTATAIRKISVSAIKHGIKVRWFDFGKYEFNGTPSGGNPGVLEPVCSVEVFPKPLGSQKMSNFALLVSLRLSRQNVESLVFYRPENKNSAGVLFLGDSRLAYGVERPKENFEIAQAKPTRRIVVTAPHHGSNKNDRAYEVLKNWLGDEKPIFIRNGGQSNQTLGGFLQNEDRRCAQCVQCHGNKWNQWVAVNAVAGDWQWPPKADACGTPRT
jgi:hypothetical protein